jgi:hypothetical protein
MATEACGANTAAATGGFIHKATRSRTFFTNLESGDTLTASCCHGLSPNACQISRIVVCEMPWRRASGVRLSSGDFRALI